MAKAMGAALSRQIDLEDQVSRGDVIPACHWSTYESLNGFSTLTGPSIKVSPEIEGKGAMHNASTDDEEL